MNDSPTIRLSTLADRDLILAFIERMGFNPRDAVTWDGLSMMAMCAWREDRLIGVIPVEPRVLCVGANQSVRSVHETVVALDPEYRSRGIGSQLQAAIASQAPANAQLVTVFREEPESPAYRWYLKNGFSMAMGIESWFCDNPAASAGANLPLVWRADDPSLPWAQVEHVWASNPTTGPGMVDRSTRGLQNWLAMHPYRRRYAFQIVLDSLGSFALLGIGNLHSQTIRADILEMMPASHDLSVGRSLLCALIALAARRDWRPLRLPLSKTDPRVAMVTELDFRRGWPFDMLVRPLGNVNLLEYPLAKWRYAGIDYI